MAEKVEAATSLPLPPPQYAFSTKAGWCECVAHMLHSVTELDPEATTISIDGVGAYDLISRKATLVAHVGDQLIPFVRCFFGSPSTYLWEDEMGVTHEIPQGDGGEEGDPLMPLLFALRQHTSLVGVMRSCSRAWMTCMRRVDFSGWRQYTTPLRKNSSSTSTCSTGRHKFGTGEE